MNALTTLPSLVTKTGAVASGPVGGAVVVGSQIVSGIVDGWKTAEVEKTKRTAIEANKEVSLAKIQSDYQLKSQELNYVYNQKKTALEAAIQFTHRAIDSGDREMQNKYFEAIAGVLKG